MLLKNIQRLFFISLFLTACVHEVEYDRRFPQSQGKDFLKNVELLQLAKQKIIFSADDSFFKIKKYSNINKQCLFDIKSIWQDIFIEVLNSTHENQDLFENIHIIQFVRAQQSLISKKTINNLNILVIGYSERASEQEVQLQEVELECANIKSNKKYYLSKTEFYVYPKSSQIVNYLKQQEFIKNNQDNWKFSDHFLTYLAKNGIAFFVPPNSFEEISSQGVNMIHYSLSQWTLEFLKLKSLPFLEEWNEMIRVQSDLGLNFRIFKMVNSDSRLGGIQVDAIGNMKRKKDPIQNGGLTSFYLSTSQRFQIKISSLKSLEMCLGQNLKNSQTREFWSSKEASPEAYLYPGLHCMKKNIF